MRWRALTRAPFAKQPRAWAPIRGSFSCASSFPNVLPGVVNGSLLVFSAVFAEFTLANLLIGTRFKTFPIYLVEFTRFDARQASALAVISFLVAWIVSLAVLLVAARRSRVTGTDEMGREGHSCMRPRSAATADGRQTFTVQRKEREMFSQRVRNLTIAVPIIAGVTMALSPALAQSMEEIAAGAAKEGQLVTYGMSDDWVNFGAIFDAIESKYHVTHTDTDMTSAEEITHLLAEKDAPVMDMADIGYDFLGPLLDNNLAAPFKNSSWDSIPADRKDPDGRWASAYWGAISILVNTDVVKTLPATWNDLLKPEYKDMVCSRDPRVSTYATASVLAAAYANGGGEDNVQPGLDWFKKLRDTGNLRKGVVLNVASVQKGECPISLVYDFDGFAKRDSDRPAAESDHPAGRHCGNALRTVYERHGAPPECRQGRA